MSASCACATTWAVVRQRAGHDARRRGGQLQHRVRPDFQWRPKPTELVTGEALWSETVTPVRPQPDQGFPAEWDGRHLSDHAFRLNWAHNTAHYDLFIQGQDLGPDFRADNGFIPQVGYREGYFETGYTLRPKNAFFSRIRMFTIDWLDAEPSGTTLARRYSVGTGADGRWNSFTRVELNYDDILVGDQLLNRFRPRFYVQASPGSFVNLFAIDVYFGDEIDFANAREGTGTSLFTNPHAAPEPPSRTAQ
jgi:hypothetical protein